MCSPPHSCCGDINCFKTPVLPHQTLFWWRQPPLQPSQGVSQFTFHGRLPVWIFGHSLDMYIHLFQTVFCSLSVAGCPVRKGWYLLLWDQWLPSLWWDIALLISAELEYGLLIFKARFIPLCILYICCIICRLMLYCCQSVWRHSPSLSPRVWRLRMSRQNNTSKWASECSAHDSVTKII